MKTEILRLLRESDSFVSGQQLCEQFQVSRTAVWKVIKQLQEEGYQIEAVRNKGYRITGSPDVMTEEELTSLLDTRWAGKHISYFDTTDSTNNQAKAMGDAGAPHGTLVVADRQDAGKGRRGRVWSTPPGGSIAMSILLRPDIEPSKAPMLTLVMAMAVAEGISQTEKLDAGIKWPNDIVLSKKKVCGILTEMSTEITCINHVVIGAGINVNLTEFPEEIAKTATSLRIEKGEVIKRSELIAAIMKRFEYRYEQFMQTEDLSLMQEDYHSILLNREKKVRILSPKEEYDGVALGINEKGELLVRRENGSVEEIFSGEVSVRGIYGYV
ncbi:MAG: biotin--[acetyl-CoA-carboxylase] ligase [Hespellia sp.]|nr:biotin--[acetyl-CoA-carboxylase] ligase [Hespellia sp.]